MMKRSKSWIGRTVVTAGVLSAASLLHVGAVAAKAPVDGTFAANQPTGNPVVGLPHHGDADFVPCPPASHLDECVESYDDSTAKAAPSGLPRASRDVLRELCESASSALNSGIPEMVSQDRARQWDELTREDLPSLQQGAQDLAPQIQRMRDTAAALRAASELRGWWGVTSEAMNQVADFIDERADEAQEILDKTNETIERLEKEEAEPTTPSTEPEGVSQPDPVDGTEQDAALDRLCNRPNGWAGDATQLGADNGYADTNCSDPVVNPAPSDTAAPQPGGVDDLHNAQVEIDCFHEGDTDPTLGSVPSDGHNGGCREEHSGPCDDAGQPTPPVSKIKVGAVEDLLGDLRFQLCDPRVCTPERLGMGHSAGEAGRLLNR